MAMGKRSEFHFMLILLFSCLFYLGYKIACLSVLLSITIASQEREAATLNASVYNSSSVSARLSQRVRVLCLVVTRPQHHAARCRHVKATWGRRCNVLLFMSTAEDKQLPAIDLPALEGRDDLWGKTRRGFKYAHKHYWDHADWFLKADDDTYVIMENLRYMLAKYSRDRSIYFGCRFKTMMKQGYMSGGAGYVLSRAALDVFVTKSLPSPRLCRSGDSGAEDVEMGKCLSNVGVSAMDSRDFVRSGRFFPFRPEDHLFARYDPSFWYWQNIYYSIKGGRERCSELAISFHYITPRYMYLLDHLVYRAPYGIQYPSYEWPASTTKKFRSTNELE